MCLFHVCCLALYVPVSFAVICAWLFAHIFVMLEDACPMLGGASGKASDCRQALCNIFQVNTQVLHYGAARQHIPEG